MSKFIGVLLTDKRVEQLLADSTKHSYISWDSKLIGFGVRVYQTGRKTFVVQYRDTNETSRRFTISPCDRMLVKEARKRARKTLNNIQGMKQNLKSCQKVLAHIRCVHCGKQNVQLTLTNKGE